MIFKKEVIPVHVSIRQLLRNKSRIRVVRRYLKKIGINWTFAACNEAAGRRHVVSDMVETTKLHSFGKHCALLSTPIRLFIIGFGSATN
mmetsp:Transcript_14748/g.17971  ORF Transcript_14748/g.17971 Transcript_14748/m.17971 type:complete len:89 (-) Transcript_14748:702-968(-)